MTCIDIREVHRPVVDDAPEECHKPVPARIAAHELVHSLGELIQGKIKRCKSPYRRLEVGHEERRRCPLSRHITYGDNAPVSIKRENIIVISPDLLR